MFLATTTAAGSAAKMTLTLRPGGNFTGVFLDLPELSGKQVELLKEIVPRLSRLAIFGIPDLNAAQFAATETAVRRAPAPAGSLWLS